MKTKADLINAIGKHRGFESYLEISTPTTGNVYDRVSSEIFKEKRILLYRDPSQRGQNRPDTNAPVTEEYQAAIDALISAKKQFDIIFVDSFHTFEQSQIDIENALSLVRETGVIVIHDCAPLRFETATPHYIRGEWYGHTYKAVLHFRIARELNICVVDTDFGCGVIQMSEPSNRIHTDKTLEQIAEWSHYAANRKSLLNLLTIDEFCSAYRFPAYQEQVDPQPTPTKSLATTRRRTEGAPTTSTASKTSSTNAIAKKNYYISRLKRRGRF